MYIYRRFSSHAGNASRHSALSYEHAQRLEAQLQAEVAELLALAEEADQAERPDGLSIPEEVERREERLEASAARQAASQRPNAGSGNGATGSICCATIRPTHGTSITAARRTRRLSGRRLRAYLPGGYRRAEIIRQPGRASNWRQVQYYI